MRIFQTEYLLKGVYLGLVLFAGLVAGALPPEQAREVLFRVNAGTLAGLAAALLVAALFRLRRGFKIQGRLVAFLLFLLLDSPMLAYVGILAGTLGGLYLARDVLAASEDLATTLDTLQNLFLPVAGAGAVCGMIFGYLRRVENRYLRIGLVLGLAGLLAVIVLAGSGVVEIKGVKHLKGY